MDRCAKLNNVGASQLGSGMYATAVDSFTGSLRIVKNALSVLAAEKHVASQLNAPPPQCSQASHQPQRRTVVFPQNGSAALVAVGAKGQASMDDETAPTIRGLYASPLCLSEDADYERYENTVEASVAIMFNLALAHHLNALHGQCFGQQGLMFSSPFRTTHAVSTLEQAIALYELAYTVHMQEDAELSVEFTMAIINNLGHIHRLMGDEEKSSQCFRHLLSTIMFLQSYGGANQSSPNNNSSLPDIFVYSISHLILRETAAAAA